MKIFDVECPEHGRYELVVHNEQNLSKLRCLLLVQGKPCGERLKKIIPTPNVHFKGSGFYSTDNRGE